MSAPKPIDRSRIAILLRGVFDALDEVVQLLEEVDTLNGGGAGISQQMNAIAHGFSTAWESVYKEPYAWTQNNRDRPAMKRLLVGLSVEEIVRRAWVYVNKPGHLDFYVDRRHPFSIFVGSINEHVGEPGSPEAAERASNCHHKPPCKNDVEHTKRYLAELHR